MPPCAAVATLLLMRAPQKSCSQKGGCKENCVSSQPPTMPAGHQEEIHTQPWAPQPTSQMLSGVCQGEAQLQLQQQVPLPGSPWQPGVCQVSSSDLESGLRLRCVWPGAWRALCLPHSGKITVVPNFMLWDTVYPRGWFSIAMAFGGMRDNTLVLSCWRDF